MIQSTERKTFIVKILDTQHATWQGTLTWVEDKQTVTFRSALELMKLMDSTISNPTSDQPLEEDV